MDKFVDFILGPKPGTPLHKQQREARLRQEERDKEFWDKWDGILNKWYYRYLGAALCLLAAWYLFGLSYELPRDWLPAFCAVGAAVSAAWLAREPHQVAPYRRRLYRGDDLDRWYRDHDQWRDPHRSDLHRLVYTECRADPEVTCA